MKARAIKMVFILVFFLALVQLQGCVTYDALYVAKTDFRAGPHNLAGGYRIKGGTMFKGIRVLKASFQDPKNGMDGLVQSTTIENQGLFIDVTIKTKAPSVEAIVSGYISVSLALLIPTWSTEDGYQVLYDVYQDGNKVKTFTYDVNRKSFAWLPMILLAWVNFATTHESEAFTDVVNQFNEDFAAFKST